MENKTKIIELFGGIGAPRKGFNNLGIEVESTYVENNKKVVNVYNLLYKTKEKVQNIEDFKPKKDDYDFLIAGFPCQPFSIAGKRLGFEDKRGKLYKDTLRVIKETLPENIILENVKGLTREVNKWIIEEIVEFLENLKYSVIYRVINSFELGYIQKRERVFIIASRTKKLDLKHFEKYLNKHKGIKERKLKYNVEHFLDCLSYDLDKIKEASNYYVIPRKKDNQLISGSYNRVWKFEKAIGTVTVSNNLKIGTVYKNKMYYRGIKPREALLYMDFDEKDYDLIKDQVVESSINFVAGNSMVVGVIQIVINYLLTI